MSGATKLDLCCNKCHKQFTNYANLKRHVQCVHEKSKIKLVCEFCSNTFHRKDNLVKHMRVQHLENEVKKTFKCPVCFNYLSREEISVHFRNVHEIYLESFVKKFVDMNEFHRWKKGFEESGNSFYVKRCGSNQRADGSVVYHYICHRSGIYKNKGKGVRQLKTCGSNKINGHCPSHIKAIETCDRRVTAFITETHAGHETDIGRLPITKSTKDDIARKIADNIPFDDILVDYRANRGKSLQRSCLLTKKDLHNISVAYNLKQSREQEEIDMVSDELSCGQRTLTLEDRIETMRQCCEEIFNCLQYEEQLDYLEKTFLTMKGEVSAMGSKLEEGIPKPKQDN